MNRQAVQRLIGNADDGGLVELPAGVHEWDGPVFISSKKRLLLRGHAEIRVDGPEAVVVNSPEGNRSVLCTVEGFHFAGGGVAVRAGNQTTVRNCTFQGTGAGVGISVEHQSHDTALLDCHVRGYAVGVDLDSVDSNIRGGTVIDCPTGVRVGWPANRVSELHLFPGVGGVMDYCVQVLERADHLVTLDGCYFDNASDCAVHTAEASLRALRVSRSRYLKKDKPDAEFAPGVRRAAENQFRKN